MQSDVIADYKRSAFFDYQNEKVICNDVGFSSNNEGSSNVSSPLEKDQNIFSDDISSNLSTPMWVWYKLAWN